MFVIVPVLFDQIEEYIEAKFAFGPFNSKELAEDVAKANLPKYSDYKIVELKSQNEIAKLGAL